MIEGAGTLNASGASDAPSPAEPVDPGLTHSLFKRANAYVLSAVREEGSGDFQRALRSYSRAIDEFIKGLQKIPGTPEWKKEKEDIRQRTEEYLARESFAGHCICTADSHCCFTLTGARWQAERTD